MEEYIKGIVTGFERVQNLIDTLDPENKIEAYVILKRTVNQWADIYKKHLENIQENQKQPHGFKEYLKK